jgi:autotransporter-associated beta strand protein
LQPTPITEQKWLGALRSIATKITRSFCLKNAAAALLMALFGMTFVPTPAQSQRALGLDISAWQGNISQTNWNNIRTNENRQFVILRSSRGGTTGFYNQNDAANVQGLNTNSQRYDDPYYVQNINRATTAGMFAGSYHFSRPDIIENTLNSGGVRNSGTDEADHFIQMAGPWMRPGYLMPVHDLEAGDGIRTDDQMAQFSLDFSNRIYERMGIRPAIYVNGNYAAFVLGTASASLRNQIAQPAGSLPNLVSPAYPTLWSARWPNQTDPNSIDVQNGEPKDSYTPIYGPWDDYGVTHPWAFWQYTSKGRLQSFNNGGNDLDMDVARGGVEFLKDYLIPAIWINDSDGQWTTLTNWNSGRTPVAPVTGPGQVAPVGTPTLPTPRLPGAIGAGGVTSGTNDTVILDRPNTNITVTLAGGTHNIRKLYMREALDISGGSLTISYVPSGDSTPIAAQFSGPVTLSAGSLRVHTVQVDAGHTFTLGGGTLVCNTVSLMPDSTTPAKIAVTADVNFNFFPGVTATIARGGGVGGSGSVDLGGASRGFNVLNGTAEVDLSLEVPIINGALTKLGAGTMRLNSANTYSGGTIVSGGSLLANNTNGSATGPGGVVVNGGIFGGTGTIAGPVVVTSGGTVAPGTASSIGRLTLNSVPMLEGTVSMKVDRNGGFPLADRIVLTTSTLVYDGALVVSNVGAPLSGGEVFRIFVAPAYSGEFATTLPPLDGGLNWDTGMLPTNGTIKVNRSPATSPLTFTHVAPTVLQIPLANLASNATDPDGDAVTLSGIDLTTTNGITLVTNNTFILYSNYVSVIDRFHYTLSDGHGGSVTGAVQITSSPVGRFTSYPGFNGDSVMLQFAGRPGWTYYLERSTNLLGWTTISTNVAPASGIFNYTDNFQDLITPPGAAFYRLRWSP